MIEAVPDFDVHIEKSDVYHLLGYRDGGEPTGSTSSLVDEQLDEARQLIEASCFYQLMDVRDVDPPRVVLENGTRITVASEILSWVLSPCQMATVFVSSIGPALESRVAELAEAGEILRSYTLDAVGSAAAGAAASHLQEWVRKLASAEGAEITFRCSPGYCDWDIREQRLLFQVMDSTQTGVELSEDCLMTPRKSVSGLIGLGWGDKDRLQLAPCHLCNKRECSSRR